MPTVLPTRVYKYGAVPLEQFPEEGVDSLYLTNKLWNRLVEIHNEHADLYDKARRDEDNEYARLSQKLEKLNENIDKAFQDKRKARIPAQTRSSEHPLIKAANEKIAGLKEQRKELYEAIKKPRLRADKLIDKKALNKLYSEEIKKNWLQRAYKLGGKVELLDKDEQTRQFNFIGMDIEGAMLLRDSSGKIRKLMAGTVNFL